jgi:hypothetical protein
MVLRDKWLIFKTLIEENNDTYDIPMKLVPVKKKFDVRKTKIRNIDTVIFH